MGLFSFFGRKRANRSILDRLYGAVVAAARQEVLYRRYAIPDTFEGRFEAITVHAGLVARRLQLLPAPGPDLAQDFIDHVFFEFDGTLREMGVGDISVPKRMKTIAAAFAGRSSAYIDALQSDDPQKLAMVLKRNIYGTTPPADDIIAALANYIRAFVARLERMSFSDFTSETLTFDVSAQSENEVRL